MTLILVTSMLPVPECLGAQPTSLVPVFHHTLEMDSRVKVYDLVQYLYNILSHHCNTNYGYNLFQLYNNGTLEVNVLCSGSY